MNAFFSPSIAAETPGHCDAVSPSRDFPNVGTPTNRLCGLSDAEQYLRDLDALDAAGGDGGCFFDAMGEVIARRMGSSNP